MPSNCTYTCVPCRYSAKQTHTCPYCQKPMVNMGKAFKPPRKSNDSQWQKIALMVEHSDFFGYCHCCRPRRKPVTSADAKSCYKLRRSDKRNYAELTTPEARRLQRWKKWIAER